MSNEPPVRGISDTAAWVAIYRALESERPDAVFRDPYRFPDSRGTKPRQIWGGGVLLEKVVGQGRATSPS